MEVINDPTPEQIHESNKTMREALAWLYQRMMSQQFYLEEADMAKQARGVLYVICTDLQKKIEEVEPPAPKQEAAPQKPYIVDVPMQSPEANA